MSPLSYTETDQRTTSSHLVPPLPLQLRQPQKPQRAEWNRPPFLLHQQVNEYRQRGSAGSEEVERVGEGHNCSQCLCFNNLKSSGFYQFNAVIVVRVAEAEMPNPILTLLLLEEQCLHGLPRVMRPLPKRVKQLSNDDIQRQKASTSKSSGRSAMT